MDAYIVLINLILIFVHIFILKTKMSVTNVKDFEWLNKIERFRKDFNKTGLKVAEVTKPKNNNTPQSQTVY